MKYSKLAAAALFFSLAGCFMEKTVGPAPEETTDGLMTDAEILSVLTASGFDASNTQFKGDTILIEGDMVSFRAAFVRKPVTAKTSQRVIDDKSCNIFGYNCDFFGTVSMERIYKVKVRLDVPGLQNTLDEVIDDFNKTGSNLHVKQIVDGTPDVVISETNAKAADGDNRFYGLAYVPVNGSPGTSIRIHNNSGIDSLDWPNWNSRKRRTVLSHELGHTLGLHHTDVVDKSDDDADHIPNTPHMVDILSVLKTRTTYPFDNYHLSIFDKHAFRVLYPNMYHVRLDIDGNGVKDRILIRKGTCRIFLNGSEDYVSWKPWSGYDISDNAENYLTGDFDKDGKDDIVHVVPGTNYFHIWYGKNNGRFNVLTLTHAAKSSGQTGRNTVIGDFNNDGLDDIMRLASGESYVVIWFGTKSQGVFNWGGHAAWSTYNWGDNASCIVGDWDGKNGDDLIHFVNGSYAHIWMNEGNGRFRIGNWTGNHEAMGKAIKYVKRDSNKDGIDDLLWAETEDTTIKTITDYTYRVWFGHENMLSTFKFNLGTGN